MDIFIVKNDTGCRKGCHPVYCLYAYRQKIEERQWFSIDEPGAWFEDKWNCHVDGTDYEFATRSSRPGTRRLSGASGSWSVSGNTRYISRNKTSRK